jgi:hypothetical protein
MSFYKNKHGKRIDLANPGRPLNLSRGGLIPHIKGTEKHPGEDTILSKLEAGSLVVPVPVMKRGVMDKYDGPVTGPVQTKRGNLVRAVVMPDEMVVHRKHAPKVERFLAKKGIRLPLGS